MIEDDDREWQQGWRVVAGSTLGLGTAANLHFYMSTFFIRGLTAEFHWSRGEFAALQAIALGGVLAAPFAGYLIDRLGLRKILVASLLLLTAIYFWAANMPHRNWAPLALYLSVQVIGQGTATVPHTRAVASWFNRRLGLALGIVITGVPVISATVSPIMASLTGPNLWRPGYYLLAGLSACVSLPAALFLVCERNRARSSQSVASAQSGLGLRQALGTRAFWLLMAAMALINLPAAAFINQLVPMMTDRGITAATAALMVSAYSVAMIVGRLGCGACVDRFEPHFVAAAFTLIPAFGFLGISMATSAPLALTFTCVFLIGVQHGAEFDLLAYFTARHFGLRRYGLLYSVGYVVVILSTSLALVVFAGSYDRSGSYDIVLFASAATLMLGALCFALLRAQTDVVGFSDRDGRRGVAC
jgi:MFS family permease